MASVAERRVPPCAAPGALARRAAAPAARRCAIPMRLTGVIDLCGLRAGRDLRRPASRTHDPLEILFTRGRATSPRKRAARRRSFVLGTTNLGRDIFSQLVLGTRAALYRRPDGRRRRGADRHGRRADRRLFRRLGRLRADAPRRHRARHSVPALRHRAGRLPRPPTRSNVVLGVALLLWPNTARVIRSPGADRARTRLRRGRAGHRRQRPGASCSCTSRRTSCRCRSSTARSRSAGRS